jgi:alkylhydroperoxidase family enzyme
VEGLPDRQRLALALADSVMTQPGQISDQLAAELQKEFSAEELVELTLKILKFNVQKVMVALGTDFPLTPEAIARWKDADEFVVVGVPPG